MTADSPFVVKQCVCYIAVNWNVTRVFPLSDVDCFTEKHELVCGKSTRELGGKDRLVQATVFNWMPEHLLFDLCKRVTHTHTHTHAFTENSKSTSA